ncbi:MAG: quinone-dependent dihydroorotate dehydrogenase [Candidatus Eremiobacterota bacterium]
MDLIYRLLKPWLFRLDPESIHDSVVAMARVLDRGPLRDLMTAWNRVSDPVDLFGVRFPNRVGLAAGFDKNARFLGAAAALGFGHLEVGTVTPLPQAGHPRPRIWRLERHESLRNRMGFPNDGAAAVAARLRAARPYPLPVGVNVGKGASTPLDEAAGDYCRALDELQGCGDYFVLNVSSPNTEGLRRLAGAERLRGILEAVRTRPLLLKLSPDMTREEVSDVASLALELSLDGLIATNTTIRRDPPCDREPPEGGLSGRVLTERSREVLGWLRQDTRGQIPLVGVGGVHDEASARALPADLVQVYTGFIYGGPGFPRRIARALKEARDGRSGIVPVGGRSTPGGGVPAQER